MVRTVVGYTGGTTPHPTYHELGDHSEAIQVVYDPEQLSYERLLAVFWQSHRPTSPAWSVQYRSAVFVADASEREAAERGRVMWSRGAPLVTDIEPAGPFFPAEDYHQKYRLQKELALMADLRRMYPRGTDFVASTAAARLNAWLGGNDLERMREELPLLGLSAAGERELAEQVGSR